MTIERKKAPSARPLPVVRTGDATNDRALDEVRGSVAQLDRSPFLRGTLTAGITIVAGENRIPHGLSRKPGGWWVTRAQGAAPRLFETESDENYIVLRSDTAALIDLWVF